MLIDTYNGIKDATGTARVSQEISRDINAKRIFLAKKNLDEALPLAGNLEELKKYFKIESGSNNTNEVTKLILDVLNSINEVLMIDEYELKKSFSLRMKQIEEGLAEQIKNTGFAEKQDAKKRESLCAKIANNIIETIVQKLY